MVYSARSTERKAPSIAYLERLIPKNMQCPVCGTKMNWLQKDGAATVITLQHDNSGKIRLICHACNVRHGHVTAGEYVFYHTPNGWKWCPGCKRARPTKMFHNDSVNKSGRRAYCKACSRTMWHKWAKQKAKG